MESDKAVMVVVVVVLKALEEMEAMVIVLEALEETEAMVVVLEVIHIVIPKYLHYSLFSRLWQWRSWKWR